MTLRHVFGATTLVVFAGGMTVGPASAQLRDGAILAPQESAVVTVAGCLLRGNQVRGGQDDKYVLAHPKQGPVASVPEGRCTADAGANALELDNPSKGNVNDAMLGQWIEISGRLERETSTNPDNLRELDVSSARIVPVVRPQAAAPAPIVEPAAPLPEPLPEIPVATSGEAPAVLPQTASHVPAIGLIGLLALAVGLALRKSREQRSYWNRAL